MNRTDGRYAKVTVSLSVRDVVLLDTLALEIRERTRVALSRSDVIYAFIEAAAQRRMQSDEAAALVGRLDFAAP
jgi:hypothetical protein